ncbi:MAG TPA: hypothetical protein VHX49_06075 [Candidatus Acidoferrales bacterium]|jgi:hypothetical protein|nr:hypothetical protein [Candidatus Acidoferrales bacterium]
MKSTYTIRMNLGTWSSHQLAGARMRTQRHESRRRKRLKLELALHVRPADGRFADHEDLGQVVDFHSEGLYFTTSKLHYAPGMKLIVTLPYGENVPAQKRFFGSVVRVEHRWIGSRGVGIRLWTDASPA